MLKGLNEPSLGSKSFQDFEMIEDQRGGIASHNTFIDSLIAILIIVNRAPDKVTLLNALRFILELGPVTSSH